MGGESMPIKICLEPSVHISFLSTVYICASLANKNSLNEELRTVLFTEEGFLNN